MKIYLGIKEKWTKSDFETKCPLCGKPIIERYRFFSSFLRLFIDVPNKVGYNYGYCSKKCYNLSNGIDEDSNLSSSEARKKAIIIMSQITGYETS